MSITPSCRKKNLPLFLDGSDQGEDAVRLDSQSDMNERDDTSNHSSDLYSRDFGSELGARH